MKRQKQVCRFFIAKERMLKLLVTTTYIAKDGRVIDEKKHEEHLYYTSILPKVRQTAAIKEWEDGYKIVVSRLSHDD